MPIYMKLEGVDGESNVEGFEKHIEVLSFSWGATQLGGGRGGGGGGAGKVNMQDFHFVKAVDKASPQLMKAACSGNHLPGAVVSFVKMAEGDGTVLRQGRQQDYYVIKLRDILVSSVRPGADSMKDDQALEAVSLSFREASTSYQGADGKPVEGKCG